MQHRPVVGKRRRLETGEAAGGGEHGQPFQQRRAKPFALEAIVDGECDFSDRARQRGVGADGNWPDVVVDVSVRDEREPP